MNWSLQRPLAVALALTCCLSVLTPVAATPSSAVAQSANPCTGTVTERANGLTVVSVQGFEFGEGGGKRPAKLVGVGPSGEVKWVHQSAEQYDVIWGYDVDPMANGNIFVTATVRGHETLVYEFDPRTQETVWKHTFDVADTHDADLIDGGSAILVANMRNYDDEAGHNEDRLFVYNRTTDEITWEWHFDDHYDPENLEENYTDDWSHVNDVDEIADGLYLASPRNFDQAIVVNRSTNEIEMKLGADGQKDVLNEQHNPDYLESANGTPTILVADSHNNRITEYANPDGDLTDGDGWNRTWTLTGDLSWPRDADRLPDGDTLVTDSSNNRVVEVTPTGEIVWEFYAPWLVYDAARVSTGEHGGPSATDLNVTGTYEIEGSATIHENQTALDQCHQTLEGIDGWAPGETPTTDASDDETSEDAMNDGTDDADQNEDANRNDAGGGEDGQRSDDGTSTDSTGVPGFGPVVAVTGLLVALGIARRWTR